MWRQRPGMFGQKSAIECEDWGDIDDRVALKPR